MRRRLALILAGMCVAAGTAACSGSAATPGGAPPATGTAQVMNVMRAWARCVRAHGTPGFPDPIINPLTNAPDFPQDAPRVPRAGEQACQSIANQLPPQSQNSQPPTAQSMQALLRFARCMRANGIAAWPDPNALGEFPLSSQLAVQFKSQATDAATNACIKDVPGGRSYLQFVGANRSHG